MRLALLALAMASFAIGTTEFVIMGLLWGWTFLALIALVWFARPPFAAAGTHSAAD